MLKNGLPPIHPGVFLRELLEELNISQSQFARAIGVSAMRVSDVVNHKVDKFTIDSLVLMLSRIGKQVRLAVS